MIFNTVKTKDTKLLNEIYECIINYNKFFNLEIKKDDIPIFILEKEDFAKIRGTSEEFVVAFAWCNKIYICKKEDIKNRYNENQYALLIKHEMAHNFLNYFLNYNHNLPIWLNEGVAVYLSGQFKEKERRRAIPNVINLFDDKKNMQLRYNIAGLFVEYLVRKYGKEKFIKYVKSFEIKNKRNIDKNNFNKVYKKAKEGVLAELLEEGFKGNFRKEINEKIKEIKCNAEIFFNEKFNNFKICIDKYIEKEKFVYDDNMLFGFNPKKSYFEKQEYYLYLSKFIFKKSLFKYCKNKKIPIWLKEGFCAYIIGYFKNSNYNEKILKLLNNDVNPLIQSIGGAFLIDYLIKNYGKEKFLEFLKNLKSAKTTDDLNDVFKTIYKKDIMQILKIMCKNKKN